MLIFPQVLKERCCANWPQTWVFLPSLAQKKPLFKTQHRSLRRFFSLGFYRTHQHLGNGFETVFSPTFQHDSTFAIIYIYINKYINIIQHIYTYIIYIIFSLKQSYWWDLPLWANLCSGIENWAFLSYPPEVCLDFWTLLKSFKGI